MVSSGDRPAGSRNFIREETGLCRFIEPSRQTIQFLQRVRFLNCQATWKQGLLRHQSTECIQADIEHRQQLLLNSISVTRFSPLFTATKLWCKLTEYCASLIFLLHYTLEVDCVLSTALHLFHSCTYWLVCRSLQTVSTTPKYTENVPLYNNSNKTKSCNNTGRSHAEQ